MKVGVRMVRVVVEGVGVGVMGMGTEVELGVVFAVHEGGVSLWSNAVFFFINKVLSQLIGLLH